MNILKKVLLALMIFSMLFTLCSCGKTEKKEVLVEENSEKPTEQENKNQESKKQEVVKATIDEQLILDYEGIRITAKGLEEGILGPQMKILIENDSANDITVSLDDIVVNDYMMSSFLYETVTSGKKSNAKFDIYDSNLKNAGITNVGKIELYFRIIDSNYNTIYESDAIELHTSVYDQMDSTINDFGKELINEGGVRIVGNYYKKNTIWGSGVVLYIENNTDRNLVVTADDLSVNGFMISEYFYQSIRPHKMAINTMYLSTTDLQENDIDEVEEISTKFVIYDADSYRNILETNEISFNIE